MYNAIEYVLNVEIGVLANKPVSVSVLFILYFDGFADKYYIFYDFL